MANTARRRAHLERILRDRRREMQTEVRHGIRDGRTERLRRDGDDIDRTDADRQGDITLALLQMRAETVRRIDAALGRLAAGTYGSCVECAKDIPERRLRALPFAARCQRCEAAHEEGYARAQQLTPRREGTSLFSDVIGS